MNDRSFDQVTDAFLAAGPVVVPDRVLDAAFEEVHLTRQRRGLWRAPWRILTMNSFSKIAVAAVAVIAVGFLGLTFLGPDGSGVGGAPSAAPSPTAAPTASPLAGTAPLTGEFTSERHGFSISYPEGWTTRPGTEAWTGGYVDWFTEVGDILSEPSSPGALWLSFASQPLGDRTLEGFVAEFSQSDEPEAPSCSATADPITIDGAAGVICGQLALVTEGGRGYWILLYTGGEDPALVAPYDDAWFRSVLATMTLQPDDAVDAPTTPPLTGQFTSDRHGFSISSPEGWSTRPATTAWTSGIVDYFNPGADLLVPGTPEDPGRPFVALASQPLGDRTREQFEADYWQIMVDDDPATADCASRAEPITIDGAAGVMACHAVLVTDGGRGYVAMLWSTDGPPYDDAWLASVLATMQLQPEDAVDGS